MNPTQAYATTTCTGTDPNSILANTTGSTVNIQPGASVASVYATTVPITGAFFQPTNSISITDNGQIIGGLTVDSGPSSAGSYVQTATSVNLLVGPNGSIVGNTAITLIAQSPNLYGASQLSLDNQGSIQSTSGAAISAGGNASAIVANLTNEATGSIGRIQAIIGNLNNSGTISGGSGSAIDTSTSTGTSYVQMSWQNSGSITSNGAAATINAAISGSPLSLTNSGTITNSGSGAAITVPSGSSNFSSNIVNAVGGTISSAGGTAISGNGYLSVTNNGTISGSGNAIQTTGVLNLASTGTITGSVEADNTTGYGGSIINLGNGGTINGSLVLGAAPGVTGNLLIIDYSGGTNLLSSITGTVSIGGTNNALILNTANGTTLGSAFTLPGAFNSVGLQLASGSTVTLGAGFSTPVGLSLSSVSSYYGSPATLVNASNLSTTGAALIENSPYSEVSVTNTGTIKAYLTGSSSGSYAVTTELAYGGTVLTNSGTITAIGGNGASVYGGASNSGTITADGTAISAYFGKVDNTGTLAGGATGLWLFGNSATNEGIISGGQIGADLSSATLANSGTISAMGGSGAVGVALTGYATVTNLQGGVINGGISAGAFYNKVSNAGTINGDVILGSGANYYTSFNTYIAAPGGVLNGNLNLGSGGDTLVVTLGQSGSDLYQGITGTVTGSGTETLLTLVTANATATLVQPDAVFSILGYDLANNATLTLTSTTPSKGFYTFAGTGTVNLTANISGTGASSVLNLTAASIQTDASGMIVPTALNFTSNGNLSVTAAGMGGNPAAAVIVGGGSSFTNAGTIIYNDGVQVPSYYYSSVPADAIQNGGSVINSGTIMIGGVAAIANPGAYYSYYPSAGTSVVNTGTISQLVGAADGIGIYDINSVTNSGTIATGGTAVVFGGNYQGTLTNSGSISSANSVAIGSDGMGYTAANAQITNQASGVISGGTGQAAIALGGGSTVVNAGTINGDVQLGAQSNAYGSGSTYVANGGMLNGNLTFGGSGNTLLVIGASNGITGTISAGSGAGNVYAQGFTTSTSIDASTVTLPTGFQTYGFGAIGSGTVLTINGPTSGLNTGLTVFGNGTVTNAATINGYYGQNIVTLAGGLNTLLGESGGVTFTNTGSLGDGVQGMAQSFANSGTIGSVQNNGSVTLTVSAAPTFTFDNSGQITGSVFVEQATQTQPGQVSVPSQVTITNSGTISYGLNVGLAANHLTLTNSGTVNQINVSVYQPQQTNGGLVSGANTATGLVNYGVQFAAGTQTLAFNNAGQINQFLELYQSIGSPVDQATATLANSGTVSGQVQMMLNSTAVTITNSGTVASTQYSGYDYGSFNVNNTTAGNGTVTLTNSGTIANADPGQAGLGITATAGTTTAPATAMVNVTNSGTISANGGGSYQPFFIDQFVATGLVVNATAPGGTSSIAITNAAGATISATGMNSAGFGEFGPGSVPPALANGGSVAVVASGQTVALTNAGTITGGGDTPIGVGGAYVAINGLSLPLTMTNLAGAIDLIGTNANLTNTGTINGSTQIFATTAAFANYGSVNGDVTLGTGAGTGTASVVEGINATVTGTVTGTAAVNTLTIDVTGGGVLNQAVLAPFVGFAAPHLTGNGTVTFSGPLALPTLVLDNATLTLGVGQTLQTAGPIALTGGTGTNSFTNYGTVNGAIVDVATTNGAGGVVNIAATASSNATFTNQAGAQLNLMGGTFTIGGLVTNQGALTVAGGATLNATAGIANGQGGLITVQARGVVNDALVNTGTVVNAGTYNADIVNQAGATFTSTGAIAAPDFIQNAGTFTVTGSTVSTPLFTNLAGGVLNGPVNFTTPGGTELVNQGTIAGNVVFGAGSNILVLKAGSQIAGTVTGGSGSNLLAIMSSATNAAPDQFSLGSITGFQQSQLLAGSVALSGSYSTGSFAVVGGHLIGNAGSTLNATTITVASGAAFGSAGIVNGNVTVNGILAPIGVMTVNGNVALGTGSTTLFTGALTHMPQLTVSGKLTIAGGATVLVGSALPQRQGSLVTLISASGGITGTPVPATTSSAFDLINTGNLLELYRPFVVGSGFGSNGAAALTMVNSLVVSQQANAALITDLAVLSNGQGLADAGKFARLTAEPYATALQIGVDNGLQITDTLRDFDHDAVTSHASGNHVFTFAQVLGNWTRGGSDAATGASAATNSVGGLLGGLGWRGGNAMISVFAGGMHDGQTIAALGATTSSHSSLYGINALAWRNGFDIAATLAFDNGSGNTTRMVPDETSTFAHYGLRTTVADLALGYTVHEASGWTMHPQIGLTHIAARRDSSAEMGSTAFDLNVDGEHRHLDFADASLRFAPPPAAAGHFAPWASVGLRVRLDSDNPLASAYLPGATDAIAAAGTQRAKTAVTYKAGFAYIVSSAATLFATYDGASGSSGSNAVNAGFRVQF